MSPELRILLEELEKDFPLLMRRVKRRIAYYRFEEDRAMREADEALSDPWGNS